MAMEVTPPKAPQTFMEVLRSWGNAWLWDNIMMFGENDWLQEAIQDGSLTIVTDGSYICEQYPALCAVAFVLECNKGRGCLIGSFSESLQVANAYQGELLGLMAIHLILLSINQLEGGIHGSVVIVSDCLGALRCIVELPPYRIPSRCKHSNILKNILVNCRSLSFTTHYRHVRAHQDDTKAFKDLGRMAQLNCICNHTAQQRIEDDGSGHRQPGSLFPLEPIGMFVQGEKLTSNTDNLLGFWAHWQLAREHYSSRNFTSDEQFDEIDWWPLRKTLMTTPRLFQLWASKNVNGIADTMSFLSHQDGQSKLCLSCETAKETCKHIVRCSETGRTAAFGQSTNKLEQWLGSNSTHPDMQALILEYVQVRGQVTCLACAISLELPPFMHKLARSQDIIG